MLHGHGRQIGRIACELQMEFNECTLLRYYVGNSSLPNSTFTDNKDEDTSLKRLSVDTPFQYYCDTFWDEIPVHMDENRNFCQVWICPKEQFQCRTGQCIPLHWVWDGEWDCSDASDELGLPEEWTGHNEHLSMDLNTRKKMCEEAYTELPFGALCNFTSEYPCYRASVPDPLAIFQYRPCVNISQIGDGIEDCYGGLDERNTLADCTGNMLGYTLRCEEGCVDYINICQKDSICKTSLVCSYKSRDPSWCSGEKDVVCLNGSCAPDARCDGQHQCSFGEDEY